MSQLDKAIGTVIADRAYEVLWWTRHGKSVQEALAYVKAKTTLGQKSWKYVIDRVNESLAKA